MFIKQGYYMEISGTIVLVVLVVLIALLFTPGRWLLGEIWTEAFKPLLLNFLPRFFQWMIESHKIVLTNLMPRVSVIKSLGAKYITYDKK